MKLTGIAAWAFVTRPKPERKLANGKKIPSRYSLNLILDEKTAAELKKEGYRIQQVADEIPGIPDSVGRSFLEIKKPAEYDGEPTSPPIVVDAAKKPYSGLIGNGSKVNVIFSPKEWEMMNQTGIAARLRKVQILDLVPFGDGAEDFDVEKGFTAKSFTVEDMNNLNEEKQNQDYPENDSPDPMDF